MKFIRLNKVNSTHLYLKEMIKKENYQEKICVYTDFQTNGIGSRGNSWNGKKGNLFFSFVLSKNDLPNDLQIQSMSIYFSYILKLVLNEYDSNVWLKWPNDFYCENKKIGGTITNLSGELVYCGIGLNLFEVEKDYGFLDIKIDPEIILKSYFFKLKKKIPWKEIFSDFKIQFHKSQKFKTTVENEKIELKNAQLNDDGSIQVNNKKVFSLR